MFVCYETLAVEAYHLFDKAATCPHWETDIYQHMYHSLLGGCGWTDESFDAETLRRVDLYWELVADGKVIPIRFRKR